MLPAVGQAALGIQVRRDDKEVLNKVRRIHHAKSFKEVSAERSFLKTLEGGCRVPVGISAKISKGKIKIQAAVFSTKSSAFLKGSLVASASILNRPEGFWRSAC